MIDVVLVAAAAILALVALVALGAAAGLPLVAWTRLGVVVAQSALATQAVVLLLAQAFGERPAEPSTHWGYLAVSVFLLPLLVGRGSPSLALGGTPTRSDFLVVALACLVAIVVLWRIGSTWG